MTVVVLLFLLSQDRTQDLEGSVYCARDGGKRRLSDFGAASLPGFHSVKSKDSKAHELLIPEET